MSRTLFVVLAVLALILSVSAQSSTSSSSSSSSSSASPLSSSSSYVTASSSTGARSSSSSSSSGSSSGSSSSTGASTGPNGGGGGSSGNSTYVSSSSSTGSSGSTSTYPANSLAVSLYLTNVNASLSVTQQVNATLYDIAYNLANELSPPQPQATSLIVQYLVMTSYAGQALAPASRRLLQTQTPITFIILGNITNLASQGVTIGTASTASIASAFQQAAQSGALVAPYSGATIPQQTPTVVTPGQGSTGGASVVASAGAALIAAAVASLALLL